MVGNFSCLCFRLLTFLKFNFFKKAVWSHFRTNVLLVLIWVKTVCIGYQQMTKVATTKERVKHLTLNAPIATKVVCFSHLLKCLKSLYSKQCGPRSDCSYICSGSTLFASILNLSVMLGNYLQQTTSADDIFRCILFFAL